MDAMTVRDDLLGTRATADPFPLFAQLREDEPVCWSETHRAWLLSRHVDVAAALADRRLSSDRIRPMLAARRAASDRADVERAEGERDNVERDGEEIYNVESNYVGRGNGESGDGERDGVERRSGECNSVELDNVDLASVEHDGVTPGSEERGGGPRTASDEILGLMSEWMVLADPPAHTRLRKLAAGAFKAQRIAALEQRIGELTDEFLDRFIAGGHTDLIEHVAYPLPATVIAEMLGAPAADRDRFREWSDELALVAFGTGGDARADRHERALAGLREMFAYFTELAARRRAEPGEDMLSALLEPSGGQQLTDVELVGMCALLLFAGHETTTNSIANGVLALLRHPDQLARLRAEPELMPTAVEELLRFDGPIKTLIRWVVADHERGGRTIRAGERVYLITSSANRDLERFADPDVLDLGRAPNPHVAFGRGVHACLGAQLARLEMRVVLGRILARLPGLRPAGAEPAWNSSLASRALTALHVEHDGAC